MKKTTAQILALTLFITFCGITPGAYAAADDLALETPNEVSWKDILSASWTKLKSYFGDSSVHAADASVSYVLKSPRNAAFGDLTAETLTVQRIIINSQDGQPGIEIFGNGIAAESAIILRDTNNSDMSPYAVGKDGTVYNMSDIYMPAPMADPPSQMGPPLAANNAAPTPAGPAVANNNTGQMAFNGVLFMGPSGGVPPGLRKPWGPTGPNPNNPTTSTTNNNAGGVQTVATWTLPQGRHIVNCNTRGYGYSPSNPTWTYAWWFWTNKPWTPPWWKFAALGPVGPYPVMNKDHSKFYVNNPDADDLVIELRVAAVPADELAAMGGHVQDADVAIPAAQAATGGVPVDFQSTIYVETDSWRVGASDL